MTSVSNDRLLSMSGITKSFGSAQVLSEVSLELASGQILGLVGENGAGKSTLIKILTGLHTADSGSILLDGKPVVITCPADAEALGIHVIHQERYLAPQLSVAEQLYLGLGKLGGAWVRRGRLEERASADIKRVTGQNIDAALLVGQLTVAQQQLIQITRAVLSEPRVLILDEPTAPLAAGEVEQLFGTLRRLQEVGVGIIYISHYLQELNTITDRITVLRNGRNAGEVSLGSGDTLDDVVELMVGRKVVEFDHGRTPRSPQTEDAALKVTGLGVPRALNGLDFQVLPGEVLAVTGLVGSGIEILADALTGITKRHGTVEVKGGRVRDVADFVARGGAYVPSNRRRDGIFLRNTVAENISVTALSKITRSLGVIAPALENKLAQRLINKLDVRPANGSAIAGSLSGGNQQKVVLAKWLASDASVLVLDQPTSGVDVGSRAQIYAQINELVDGGAAVLLISVDLEELVGIADRTLVLYRGNIAAELSGNAVTTEKLLAIASGTNGAAELSAKATNPINVRQDA
ncbi:sugar ABC transporter ATP-binding protein [Paeniglutamicibacter terrestris]|uniref:Sugar ABC transporter ATP-binding protein n=1 Tax=Paeniglutamicibacter terrestris TaxID=2723403 RepID=A0ABX1G669_9MICC|nr:sugar ABC transporter ATP-binding protein [Paeniglutamicibacter terrestris]ASN40628.1 sugar ABC transporter [Arthrobacter sp. 7749]NKG21020.1 sugar ABC transporter ATP-binding protein [Paeniglutamicibacter terrestris]